jgi:RNA polymerase sigma-70 factor (ECF subfamily)
MPPLLTWFAGRADVARFLAAAPVFAAPGRLRLVPVRANGQPAFAAYQREPDGAYRAYAITVPTVTATGIARIVTFFDPDLFGPFGLPATTPGDPAGL